MRCVTSLFVLLVGIAALSGAQQPNIIVIMSDDMGYSDLGCYGSEINTPHLDALAASGIRFTQFYNTGRCCPTRASLLTGLAQHQAGIGLMTSDAGFDAYRGDLSLQVATIPEVLRPAGYRTYMAGKWHVTRFIEHDSDKHNWPQQRGFDRFYGTITGAGSFFDPATLCKGNTQISPFADPDYKPETYYYTDAITEHAVRFITDHQQQNAEQPFFMYVAYTAAHWPMHALPEDIAKYRGKYDSGYDVIRRARFAKMQELGVLPKGCELSPLARDWDAVTNKAWDAACMEVYAAMIDRMDQGIGRIVSTLKSTGRFDNTLILFLQDNGGCAEPMGRTEKKGHPTTKPATPPYPTIAPDALIPSHYLLAQTRDGYPTLMGQEVMPGGPETYMAYGIGWANVSNTPFRYYKHYSHEGGISSPLIAHWPAGIPAARNGSLANDPAHLIDIMATCVGISGATFPSERNGQPLPGMEGISLVPAFNGDALERGRPLFFEHEGNRAVRDGRWKLVAKHPGPWELYDMETDRAELHDLAAEQPDRVATMTAAYDAWAQRVGVQPWPLKRKKR